MLVAQWLWVIVFPSNLYLIDFSSPCYVVIGILLIVIAIVLFRYSESKIRKNVAPFDQAIAQKTQELRKHRAIVKEI